MYKYGNHVSKAEHTEVTKVEREWVWDREGSRSKQEAVEGGSCILEGQCLSPLSLLLGGKQLCASISTPGEIQQWHVEWTSGMPAVRE